MRKKRMLKTSAKLWNKIIPYLSRKELLGDFIKEIKECYEFGFFIGMCEGILERDIKNYEKTT